MSMGKGLEALNYLEEHSINWHDNPTKRSVSVVEKELKAFEIVKRLFEKYDYELVKSSEDGKPIHLLRLGDGKKKWRFVLVIGEEEFDLLKEALP